jgi:hypothetical protein
MSWPFSLASRTDIRPDLVTGAIVVLGVLFLSMFGGTPPETRSPPAELLRPSVFSSTVSDSDPFGDGATGVVAVRTNDTRLLDNTRLVSEFALPSTATNSPAAVNLWLVEPFIPSEEVGVGLAVNVSHGSIAASAEWGTWYSNGSSVIHANTSLAVSPGTPVTLSIASSGGDEWSLTANGAEVPSTPGSHLDLGVSVADNVPYGGGSALPEPFPAIVVTSAGPFPFGALSWTEGFAVGSGTSRVLPGNGYVEDSGSVWGAAGQDQRVGAAPDVFNESASFPILPNGTNVWGIGNVNFPPVAAWTSTDPSVFSIPGGALDLTVPEAELPSKVPIGICQELLEPLDNGRWLTVGACWDDGVGVRAYAAVTDADGAAYQQTMYVSLPSAGETALVAVRNVGHGVWQASVNGQIMVDASGNSSIVGGADLGNSTMGPYGALRGFPASALPTVLTFPEGILVYRSPNSASPYLPPEGRIADSDAHPPALVEGHLQNASLPNGTIQVIPGRAPLPFQTPLWGTSETNGPGSWAAFLFDDGNFGLGAIIVAVAIGSSTIAAILWKKRHYPARELSVPIGRGGSPGQPPNSGG